MNIYKDNVYKYGVPVFDTYGDYMRWVYGPQATRFSMSELYHMVDTTITRRYRVYSMPQLGFELRFKNEKDAAWFQLAKGRFTK